jgi:hypothetical protein
MARSSIGREELLGHLQKSRVVKPGSSVIDPGPYADGIPQTAIRGVDPVRSVMLNPSSRLWGHKGHTTIRPNKAIDYRILRNISSKAWLINTLILHQTNRVRPFLKPSTDKNVRGFQLRLKDRDQTPSDAQRKRMKELETFLLKTGFQNDPERRDDLTHFTVKAIRDYFTIDQVTTELQRTASGRVFAYWAVDPATIIRCTEQGYEGNDAIRYIQEIDQVITAQYTDDDLIFDYGTPRSDINFAGYGYSHVEQAIDLIISQIQAFLYNAASMTEDNLPRGMLLLNGDADLETVDAISEYIIDIMSAGPGAKWKIPIIPSGTAGGDGAKRAMEWVNFRTSNRDQEYVEWTDRLWSAVAALFGVDLEELGIRTKNSGSVLNDNIGPRIEESKSRGLASTLSFLESHYQKVLDRTEDGEWVDFEFVGYERDDPKLKSDQREADLRTYKTIDELRIEADLEPFGQEWSQMPLNPSVVQMVMADKQNSMMGQDGGMGPQGPEGDQDYQSMMLGEDGAGADPQGGDDGWGDGQGVPEGATPGGAMEADQGEPRAEKSFDDEVIEIII